MNVNGINFPTHARSFSRPLRCCTRKCLCSQTRFFVPTYDVPPLLDCDAVTNPSFIRCIQWRVYSGQNKITPHSLDVSQNSKTIYFSLPVSLRHFRQYTFTSRKRPTSTRYRINITIYGLLIVITNATRNRLQRSPRQLHNYNYQLIDD